MDQFDFESALHAAIGRRGIGFAWTCRSEPSTNLTRRAFSCRSERTLFLSPSERSLEGSCCGPRGRTSVARLITLSWELREANLKKKAPPTAGL
jgi:hypothetical protein